VSFVVASARYAMRYPDDKQAIEPMPIAG